MKIFLFRNFAIKWEENKFIYYPEREYVYNSVFFLLYIINEGQSLGIKNEACGKIPKS